MATVALGGVPVLDVPILMDCCASSSNGEVTSLGLVNEVESISGNTSLGDAQVIFFRDFPDDIQQKKIRTVVINKIIETRSNYKGIIILVGGVGKKWESRFSMGVHGSCVKGLEDFIQEIRKEEKEPIELLNKAVGSDLIKTGSCRIAGWDDQPLLDMVHICSKTLDRLKDRIKSLDDRLRGIKEKSQEIVLLIKDGGDVRDLDEVTEASMSVGSELNLVGRQIANLSNLTTELEGMRSVPLLGSIEKVFQETKNPIIFVVAEQCHIDVVANSLKDRKFCIVKTKVNA